ncbi:MAG: hypothetical protein V7637_1948 [Mycobacteriales bacterium]
MPSESTALSSEAQELLRRRLAGLAQVDAPAAPAQRAEHSRRRPLSPDQRRLWFLDQLKPNRADYNVAAAWRLSGPVSPGALDAALVDVVSRQDALRTAVAVGDGETWAWLAPPPTSLLQEHDLSTADDPIGTARRLAFDESRRPLDLENGPLYRFWLARLGPDDHVFGVTVHHLVFDRDSLVIMLEQLFAAYERAGSLAPTEPGLPSAGHADYARTSPAIGSGARHAEHLDYWRRQLAGVGVFLDLPTDHERPRGGLSGVAGEARVEFGSGDTAAIRALADGNDTTPFAVCLAAFEALLYRCTGAASFAVGCPFTARDRVESERLIGFFTRSLPIVTRLGMQTDPTFCGLVHEAREAMLAAHEHQETPLEDILALVQPPREVSHNPLFQVWFDYAVGDADDVPWPPHLTATAFPCGDTATRFDLELHLTEKSRTLEARLLYSAELFEADTAEQLAGSYRRLLAAAAAAPDTRLSRLPLLGQDDIETIVNAWSHG